MNLQINLMPNRFITLNWFLKHHIFFIMLRTNLIGTSLVVSIRNKFKKLIFYLNFFFLFLYPILFKEERQKRKRHHSVQVN